MRVGACRTAEAHSSHELVIIFPLAFVDLRPGTSSIL